MKLSVFGVAALIAFLLALGLIDAPQAGAQDDPFGGEVPPPAADLFGEADPFGAPVDRTTEAPASAEQPAESSTPATESAVEAAPVGNQFEIELIDGTLLHGEVDIAEIDVVTKYGALKIPLAELKSIVPGLATQRPLHERITGLIDRLGGDKFQEREEAQAQLIMMGAQVRALLQTAATSDNLERAKRAQAILEKLADVERTWGPSPSKPLAQHDEITTTQFTASGQVQAKVFTVHGLYGTVQVQLEHIKSLRRAGGLRSAEFFAATKVTGEHIANVKPFDSQIVVQRGDQVTIRAGGTIKRSGTVFVPDGNADYGQFDRTIPVGALLVQAGAAGERRIAGSKCSFTADLDGPLFFSLAMPASFTRSTPLEGQYEVQVRVNSPR
jgi:hypothetical protein